MDQLESLCGTGHTNWPVGAINYKRIITKVNNNQITLDAPIVDPIDKNYNSATLAKYTWTHKIEECGVENIRLESAFKSNVDEDHGWVAIKFKNIENAWVKNVNAYYFGFGCVSALSGSYKISIENSGMFDYKSIVTGGRRYGFYSDGCDLILFKNCISDKGRHDFVQGSKTPGPNVYTYCSATNSTNDSGPHHRWATGTLWDNITTNNALNVQNRQCSGSGHGWSGAQQVFWNSTAAKEIIIQDPPGSPINWAVGCTATITNNGDFVEEPLGIVQSTNNPITAIPSLYEAQLKSRLSTLNLKNIKVKNNINIVLYPNPSKNLLYIKNVNEGAKIKIYNTLGQLVKEKNFINSLDISSLKIGLYILVILNDREEYYLEFSKE